MSLPGAMALLEKVISEYLSLASIKKGGCFHTEAIPILISLKRDLHFLVSDDIESFSAVLWPLKNEECFPK